MRSWEASHVGGVEYVINSNWNMFANIPHLFFVSTEPAVQAALHSTHILYGNNCAPV